LARDLADQANHNDEAETAISLDGAPTVNTALTVAETPKALAAQSDGTSRILLGAILVVLGAAITMVVWLLPRAFDKPRSHSGSVQAGTHSRQRVHQTTAAGARHSQPPPKNARRSTTNAATLPASAKAEITVTLVAQPSSARWTAAGKPMKCSRCPITRPKDTEVWVSVSAPGFRPIKPFKLRFDGKRSEVVRKLTRKAVARRPKPSTKQPAQKTGLLQPKSGSLKPSGENPYEQQ
jgi:hypothetical protein